ncbi:26921_t:CDS:2 [Dentiscutata erythropus]|uniref:26921_t:CDS:1 n=1 Tax=Dentiscutata erythropus TaxID=1348616 RepID=A0A9N9IYF3_9GLOM|nr:26921_t:CDS:2 [Dentiscutata erythropus]
MSDIMLFTSYEDELQRILLPQNVQINSYLEEDYNTKLIPTDTYPNNYDSYDSYLDLYDDLYENINIKEFDEKFLSDSEVNKKYCKKEKDCRFLFIYYHSGQESKANIHLKTFSHIAGILDRTMVLTNVGRSRIESCNQFPFEFYYNLNALRNLFPKVNFISQLDFENWSRNRFKKPTIQHLHLSHDDSLMPILEQVNPIIEPVTHINCFNKFDLKFDNIAKFQRISINSEVLLQVNDGNDSSTLLIKNLMDSDAEILLIKDDIGKEILTQTHSAIPYANHIIKEALRIKVALKSYVAVYWRMEGVNPKSLPECAKQLSNTLQYIREIHGISNVYLSTDYPISTELNDPFSQFSHLTEYYNQAMKILNSTTDINIYSRISFDTFGKLRNRIGNNDEFIATDGVQRILDRIVCIGADYFLSGPANCCEQLNTFIRTVINARNELSKFDDSELQNIISRW